MEYNQYITVINFMRPRIKDIDQGFISTLPEIEQRICQILSVDNRFLPEYLSDAFMIKNIPARFSRSLVNLLSLSNKDFGLILIKLGICFCHKNIKNHQNHDKLTEILNSIDDSLYKFSVTQAVYYGDFYETYPDKLLKSIHLNEDYLETDMKSFGISLLVGYLKKYDIDVTEALRLKCHPSTVVIKSISEVPKKIRNDPTSKIYMKILNELNYS